MADPRIPPLPDTEWSDEQRKLLEPRSDNIFATMARHPRLMARWLPFARKLLLGSSLPPRDRELVILRVAWQCNATYEWGQHVGMAREAGLTDEEIVRVAHGGAWHDADFALVTAVDELVEDHCLSDGTWEALSSRYTEEQMIELPLLAGHYIMLAGALNSFRVPVDAGLPRFGAVD
jgi:alkylhydroperoxidase family enzyme